MRSPIVNLLAIVPVVEAIVPLEPVATRWPSMYILSLSVLPDLSPSYTYTKCFHVFTGMSELGSKFTYVIPPLFMYASHEVQDGLQRNATSSLVLVPCSHHDIWPVEWIMPHHSTENAFELPGTVCGKVTTPVLPKLRHEPYLQDELEIHVTLPLMPPVLPFPLESVTFPPAPSSNLQMPAAPPS